jgi:Tfp pilus assembly protein PilN
MKREINLRTREFTVAREFYWPRVLITLGVVGMLAALVITFVLLYFHQVNLEAEVAALESHKIQLEQRVVPVRELEARIREITRTSEAYAALKEAAVPWSIYFNNMRGIAAEDNVTVNFLSTGEGGAVQIDGRASSMRWITAYVRLLNESEAYRDVTYHVMYLDKAAFDFTINAKIVPGRLE